MAVGLGAEIDDTFVDGKESREARPANDAFRGFSRHFKASIAGTHISVSEKYLGFYAKKLESRFNRRADAVAMRGEFRSTFRLWNAKRG